MKPHSIVPKKEDVSVEDQRNPAQWTSFWQDLFLCPFDVAVACEWIATNIILWRYPGNKQVNSNGCHVRLSQSQPITYYRISLNEWAVRVTKGSSSKSWSEFVRLPGMNNWSNWDSNEPSVMVHDRFMTWGGNSKAFLVVGRISQRVRWAFDESSPLHLEVCVILLAFIVITYFHDNPCFFIYSGCQFCLNSMNLLKCVDSWLPEIGFSCLFLRGSLINLINM